MEEENYIVTISKVKKPHWLLRIILEILDLGSFFLMALGIVLCIRFFIFSPFTVIGQSMDPTFYTNDFVIIDKISSQKTKLSVRGQSSGGSSIKAAVMNLVNALPTIGRGDIVVFVPPGKDIHYIKRVIGLPGETVSIADNKVTICKTGTKECFVLNEDYLPKDYKTLTPCGISSFEVSDGLFVMGDNREHSTDSRCCFTIGCYGDKKWYIVPYNYIIWKVRLRVFPVWTRF